jgi:predicted Rossmann fold nucleotide-binding protein DprA/Smf involved in DNA uptake
MRVAIVGSREYSNLNRVREFVKALPPGTVVISGGARGVDHTAATAARIRGLEVVEYLAEWEHYGQRAGFMRNADIVAAADRVVAFWDGQSRGTQHTIQLATNAGKDVTIYR